MTVCFVRTLYATSLYDVHPDKYEDLEDATLQCENVESFVESELEYTICMKCSVHSDYQIIRVKKVYYNFAFATTV